MSSIAKQTVEKISKVFHVFPIEDHKIFLMNFNGTFVGHDAKAFAIWIQQNRPEYKIYWGARDKKAIKGMQLEGVTFVKINSLQGFFHMLTAKVLLYNVNPPSFLAFRKQQILINTWHGFPIKLVGNFQSLYSVEQINKTTLYLSDAKICTDNFIRKTCRYIGTVETFGTPRTDIFFSDAGKKEARKRIEKQYHVEGKKLVLYAPTFRGSTDVADITIDVSGLRTALENKYGGTWAVLFRLHPMIKNLHDVSLNSAVDVTDYQDTQDLLCAADVLITDYSSTAWDFSLMYKPVFIYAPDRSEYEKDRGLMVPIELWPYPCAETNESLFKSIQLLDQNAYIQRVQDYQAYCGNYDVGLSCKKIMDYIESSRRNNK